MIIALQYHDGDLEQAMALARLVADLVPAGRCDVMLALVCQPGTPRTGLVARTAAHCRRKLPVLEAASKFGAKGHPEGCTALWRGTASFFFDLFRNNELGREGYHSGTFHGASLLMLDGGDGIPLHPEWTRLMTEEHYRTLNRGKLITGTPYFLGGCPLHVNPNAIFELEVFGRTHLLDEMPPYDGTVLTNFDVYHREEMLAHASLSSIVRTDWRGGGRQATLELLRERAERAVWLHGYKDLGLHWLARRHLADRPAPPRIAHYDLPDLRIRESVQRDFEEAGR
jgi:hypothetical protein